MKYEINIPSMGESVTEALIGTLLKPSGAMVKEGDELIELETEKVNQVLYASTSGSLTWTIHEGESVKIGQQIGFIEEHKETLPIEPPSTPPPAEAKEKLIKEEVIQEEAKPPPQPAQPRARAETSPKALGSENRRKMTKIRQTIARRLVDALHQSAMLTTFNEVNMSAIIELRTKYKESFLKKHGVKLGLMPFFVKATSDALRNFLNFNSYIDEDDVVTHSHNDIGIAVSTDRGLVVPVIRKCEEKSFVEIEKAIGQFAEKARSGKLAITDLEGGSFTITNGGLYGSMLSTPILNPPQSGILGMHNIIKRPIVENDQVVIRPMMYLALSYDHRLIDGQEAVTFLIHIKQILEDPTRLIFFDEI